MDIKKKILLGDSDILSKNNEDLFMNINLDSTFSIIRNDKFENVFDVEKQFKKERNSSLNFRVYGIIDSTAADCDNMQVNVFSDSGATGLFNLVTATTSTSLVYNGINVYGKKRGKYLIELDDYNKDFIYIQIPSNNLTFKTQTYTQQLIFKDSEGTLIEYGTQTLDIDNDGNVSEVNNNFYYLYNKHWIKKDLLIVEEKPAKIFINADTSEIPRVNEASTPADRVTIIVSLDKPSPFGLEKANLGVLSSTLDTSEITVTDFNFNFLSLPYTMSFTPGEQDKTFYFYSPLDNIQEFLEGVTFELTNFLNVNTGSPLQYSIEVEDKTPRNKIKLNFQDVYQNRNYFTGRVLETNTNRYSFNMPSVLRNGLFFEGTPMEFYPSDNYVLKIKNIGDNTILPVNTRLGINQETLFLANQEMTFNILQEYQNTELNSIKFTFLNLNSPTNGASYYSLDNGFRINGVPFVKYGYNFRISYKEFLAYFTRAVPPGYPSQIDGWSFSNLEVPFTLLTDEPNLTITIVAKSPGTRLDLSSYGDLLPDLFGVDSDTFATLGIKAEMIQDFVYAAQKPLEIELGANFGGNLFGRYQYTIEKTGYDTMRFTGSSIPASLNPDTYYLVSGLNTVLRNWNDSTSSVVYQHGNVTSNWGTNANANNPVYGQYKTGEVYINGMVLLANQYLSNTLTYSSYPQASNVPALNSSHAINSSGDFSHDFLPAPISVIPETASEFSISDIAQVGFLGITRPTLPTIPTNLDSTRSFDFRTGNTAPYNTYTFNNTYSFGSDLWQYTSAFFSSGGTAGTNHTTSPPLTLKAYLQNGSSAYGVTSQGLIGVSPVSNSDYNTYISPNITMGGSVFSSWIKLTSATPGVPFEFRNFKEMQNTSTNQDYYNYSTMQFIETIPNQQAGVTINLANNKMGGFSVTHP